MEKVKNQSLSDEFNSLVDQFLLENENMAEGNRFKLSWLLSDLMYQMSGISAEADMAKGDDISTAYGVAIMPTQGARCLKEAIRSFQFLRGVKRAITHKLTENGQVHLLYAGSGPWGSLLIPLLHLFSPKQLQITVLDIHQENIEAIHKVIKCLDMQAFFSSIEVADATAWQPTPAEQEFDIIVSETMNSMLKREPQVSIFAHLQQYLTPKGLLIPEEVRIEAWATPAKPAKNERQHVKLKDVFTLHKASAQQIHQGQLSKFEGHFILPKDLGDICHLEFRTLIKVYQDIELTRNQSSLNASLNLNFVAPVAGTAINYCYQINNSPDWTFDYQPFSEKVSLIKPFVKSKSGLMYLYRFWDKYRRIPISGVDPELASKEQHLDILLVNRLGIEYHDALSFIMSELPDLEEFEDWIETKQNTLKLTQIREFNRTVSSYDF